VRKNHLRLAAAVAAAVAVAAVVAVVGSAATASTQAGPQIGLVLSGPSNDKGYYEQVTDATKAAAAKYHGTMHLVENVGFDPQKQATAITNLARAGNTLIIVDGVEGDAAAAVAPKFPKIQFVIHTAPTPKKLPNLHAYVPQQGIPTYIMGVIAAKLSKSHKVATLEGYQDIPSSQSAAGFKLGAQAASPKLTVGSVVVGSYSDPVKGKQAGAAQIANGADVLNVYLDAGFPGVAQAVAQSHKKVYLFGSTAPHCSQSPMVVGTAYTGNSVILGYVVRDYLHHTLPVGTRNYGLNDPAVQRVTLCPKFNTPALRAVIAKYTKMINSGAIKLPKSVTG
jgi:basic membrane protein A